MAYFGSLKSIQWKGSYVFLSSVPVFFSFNKIVVLFFLLKSFFQCLKFFVLPFKSSIWIYSSIISIIHFMLVFLLILNIGNLIKCSKNDIIFFLLVTSSTCYRLNHFKPISSVCFLGTFVVLLL